MKKKQFIGLFAAILSVNAWAAEPSDEAVERWMKTQHFEETFIQTAEETFNTGFALGTKDMVENMPSEKRAAVEQAMSRYAEKLKSSIVSPEAMAELKQSITTAAKKVYTQEEIEAMTQFYGTPTGQSIIRKMPQFASVSAEGMGKAMALIQEPNAKYYKEFIEELTAIQKSGKAQAKKKK